MTSSNPELKIGDFAPSFVAPDQHGSSVRLSDFKGSNLVLYFYPKDNTPGCTTEALDFQAALGKFSDLNTKIVGVSKDSVRSHTNFCAKQNLTFTLLSDETGRLCQDYGCWVEKKNYGKTYWGIQRSTFLISAEGVFLQVWPNVRVGGHVEKVLAFVSQLSPN